MSEVVERYDWKFTRFNPRRRVGRDRGAAEVEFFVNGVLQQRLWMTRTDIKNNIVEFGRHPELDKAMQAYRDNVDFPPREKS